MNVSKSPNKCKGILLQTPENRALCPNHLSGRLAWRNGLCWKCYQEEIKKRDAT